MKRSQKVFLVVLFATFLAVVGIQEIWRFVPQGGKLTGMVEQPAPVEWNWAAIRSGQFTRNLEKWYDQRVGLRSVWVALDNQINYSVFGEVTPRKNGNGTQIVAGSGDWFYELHYIKEAVQPPWNEKTETTDVIKAYAERLRTVQAKLARRGIPLLLVVAPNKARIYPEHVPPAMLAGRTPGARPSNFERARPIFEAAGINFYDGPADYAARKAAGETDLFPRSGTHWSYTSVVPVLQKIRGKLNPAMRRAMPEIKVAASPVGPPRGDDSDLLRLANLVVPSAYAHPLPYPEMSRQTAVPEKDLPRILWVYDSFGMALQQLLYDANAIQPAPSLRNISSKFGIYRLPGWAEDKDHSPVNLGRIDWPAYLKDHDAVVIVWTEIAFVSHSWGFLEALDEALD